MAANCPPLADWMLYRHQPALNPARFHKNSGGGLLSSIQWLPRLHNRLHLRGIEPPSPQIMIRSYSSPQEAAATTVVDEENIQSMLSSPLMFVPPLSEAEEDDDYNDYFHFLSVAPELKKFKVNKKLAPRWQREYLTPDDAVCVGSSHGWLVFLERRNCVNLYLFNPLALIMSSSSSSSSYDSLPYIPLPTLESIHFIKGLRLLKSDYLSPSPSLIRDFLKEKPLHDKPYSQVLNPDYIMDVVLSSSPSPSSSSLENDNCTVSTAMMNICGTLYFCKLGVDERWTRLENHRDCCDIIYFSKDGRFYVLGSDEFHQLESWDLRDHSSPKHAIIDPTFSRVRELKEMKGYLYNPDSKKKYGNVWYVKYLVESSGDLLLVFRWFSISKNWELPSPHNEAVQRTFRFVVHKLNFDLNKWEPVECLNGRALFVGYNHSYSLTTRDYPELTQNSIYFTDNTDENIGLTTGHDNGIFHLEDNSITFYRTRDWKLIDPHSLQVPSPVWVAKNAL